MQKVIISEIEVIIKGPKDIEGKSVVYYPSIPLNELTIKFFEEHFEATPSYDKKGISIKYVKAVANVKSSNRLIVKIAKEIKRFFDQNNFGRGR